MPPITPKGTANKEEPQPEGDTAAKGTANGGEPQPKGDMAAKGGQLEPGLGRRLFDKELDNQHEEALLTRLALQSNIDHDLTQRVVVWAHAADQVSTQVELLWPLKLPTMHSSPLKARAAKASCPFVSGSTNFHLQHGTCTQLTSDHSLLLRHCSSHEKVAAHCA